MFINYWAIAFIVLICLRVMSTFYHLGGGKKIKPVLTYKEYGEYSLIRTLVELILLLGTLGYFQ